MPESLSESLNLFFPQWQGAARLELYEGAKLLYPLLSDRRSFTKISTPQTYSLAAAADIVGYSQIHAQLLEAVQVIQTLQPERIFTLGGDCGVEIAPVSWLNQQHAGALTVIWLDAHGDLNTPASSPSGHFHGMPLRLLLGEGNADLAQLAFSTLQAEQVFLVGAREFDLPESHFIKQQRLSTFSAVAVNDRQSDELLSALQRRGADKLYIHLDLDVIEPSEFPHVACPTPGGVQIDALAELVAQLHHNFDVVGCSLLEFLPSGSHALATSDALRLLKQVNLPLLTGL
ncbi:MAG: arginase family protein [Cyanobacteria bacterium P01_A01_bin.70]